MSQETNSLLKPLFDAIVQELFRPKPILPGQENQYVEPPLGVQILHSYLGNMRAIPELQDELINMAKGIFDDPTSRGIILENVMERITTEATSSYRSYVSEQSGRNGSWNVATVVEELMKDEATAIVKELLATDTTVREKVASVLQHTNFELDIHYTVYVRPKPKLPDATET